MRGVKPLDLVETIREGILVLEPDLTIRFANRSFYDTFAVAPEHTIGRKLYEIGNGQRSANALSTVAVMRLSRLAVVPAPPDVSLSPPAAESSRSFNQQVGWSAQ